MKRDKEAELLRGGEGLHKANKAKAGAWKRETAVQGMRPKALGQRTRNLETSCVPPAPAAAQRHPHQPE